MPIERTIRFCLAGVSVSLLLVGLVSGTFVRHIIQIIPMIITIVIARKNQEYGIVAGLSLLGYWLLIMVFIWMFLLGIARIVSGHYTVAEIILTIVIASFSSFGIFNIARHSFHTKKYLLAIIFIAGFVVQHGVLILSYKLPL